MSIKEAIREAAIADATRQRELARDTSREDKEKFIFSRGWRLYGDDGQFGKFYTRDGAIGGCMLDAAFKAEHRELARETRDKAVKQGEVSPLPCNKCGGDLGKSFGDERAYYYGLVDASASGGYDSDHLSDGVIYTFSLCEKCLMELFEQFKTPPHVETYI